MYTIIKKLAILWAVGILFSPNTVIAEGPPDDLHHQAAKDCVACHSAFNQEALSSQQDKCNQCHAEPLWIKAGENRSTSEKKYPKGSTIKVDSVLMYYANSKIGTAPNSMIRIPAGSFIMGTDARLPDEGPQHTVVLPAFEIDQYEVTNAQYKQFNDALGRRSPDHFRSRTYPAGKADHPVTFVTWNDAHDYCQWAGKRLPTQEEWEKAARGNDARIFPWGDGFDINAANTPLRWSALGEEGDTTPAGSFEKGRSPYGLYDMSGNVWEWTQSWYQPYPGSTWESENYGEKYKVLKGGSWWDCSFYECGISAPVYNRSFFQKRTKNASFGFRCARDIKE